MLVDYTYYTDTYGGTATTAAAFAGQEKRAEAVVTKMTYGRVTAQDDTYGMIIQDVFCTFTADELDQMRMAVCAVVDGLVALDKAEQMAMAGSASDGNVKSRTSGGESVTYAPKTTMYDQALVDPAARYNLLRQIALRYVDIYAFRFNPFYAGSDGRWL